MVEPIAMYLKRTGVERNVRLGSLPATGTYVCRQSDRWISDSDLRTFGDRNQTHMEKVSPLPLVMPFIPTPDSNVRTTGFSLKLTKAIKSRHTGNNLITMMVKVEYTS